MDKLFRIEDIGLANIKFWNFYFHKNYGHTYDKESGMTVYEMVEETMLFDEEWVDNFTQYCDGVLEECDGYIENPTTLMAALSENEVLKIEFHPGNTIFFINEKEIGCTGPHYGAHHVPYTEVENLLNCANGEVLFLLLLPIVLIEGKYIENALKTIISVLQHFFPVEICTDVARCIVNSQSSATE